MSVDDKVYAPPCHDCGNVKRHNQSCCVMVERRAALRSRPDATALREALEGLRLKHKVCEDSWYSCPMSEEACANPSDSGCTCGAESHNKRLDDILALLRSEPREEKS